MVMSFSGAETQEHKNIGWMRRSRVCYRHTVQYYSPLPGKDALSHTNCTELSKPVTRGQILFLYDLLHRRCIVYANPQTERAEERRKGI